MEDYLRALQALGRADVGSFTVRPLRAEPSGELISGDSHPWEARLGGPVEADEGLRLSTHEPELRAFANSRFPTGQNDGVVWQGRGFTTALDAGVTAKWRGLTVGIRPTLLFTQNRSFELAPVVPQDMPLYAYPWRRIDLPQRFGPDPLWELDPGQSEVRWDFRGASVGFGTRSLWWGPGVRNAIIMSNNAPGIPHAFLGTDGPVDLGVGTLETRWIWGSLKQSEWFDPAVTQTERFLTGIVAAFSPTLLSGLSIGFTRVFYLLEPTGGVGAGDYFAVFQGVRKKSFVTPQNPTGDDEHDQLFSAFGRWVLPDSGFELYLEWARNDHSWDVRDFLLEPEHSSAYTIGLQKSTSLSSRHLLLIRTELTHLEKDATFQVRDNGTYYEHGRVGQGYTHRGQIIGAGIGPGGNSQHVGADLYAPWGRAGFYLQRDVHDNDAYYPWAAANNASFCCHDVSFRLGLHGLRFVGDFELGAGAVATREFNRYFFGLDLWNLNLSFSARWRPR